MAHWTMPVFISIARSHCRHQCEATDIGLLHHVVCLLSAQPLGQYKLAVEIWQPLVGCSMFVTSTVILSFIDDCCNCGQPLRHEPNYLILVDTRDRPKQLTTYVAEDNLEVLHRNVVCDLMSLFSVTGFRKYCDAVGWVIWPVKVVPEMTCNVSSAMLSLYSLTRCSTSIVL